MDRQDIKIRVAKEQDAKEILDIYAPYVEQTAITFEYEIPSLIEFKQRIHHTLQKYPYLVAKMEGEILGYAYASAFHARAAYDWCVETSIYVKMDKKRMGIGVSLYRALELILVWMEKQIGEHLEHQPRVKRFDEVKDRVKERYGIV